MGLLTGAPARYGMLILGLLFGAICGTSALAHGGHAAPLAGGAVVGGRGSPASAFVAPAVDLRLRRGEKMRAGVCAMQMQQHSPRDEAAVHAADKLRGADILGEAGPGTEVATGSEGAGADERMRSNGVMLASRRSALGVGLGLLLGPMIPIVTTALTGQPAAHAATGAAASSAGSGDGAKKPFDQKSLKEILGKAGSRALGGGRSGAAAGVLQVFSLMWLRTTMNYQYRYGGSTREVLTKLYEEGGFGRFYRGIGFALVQQPLSRFGDTAANAGMAVLLDSFELTSDLPVVVKTVSASLAAALWRIGLMPVDSFKTTLQVDGKDGVQTLLNKIERRGLGVLYDGSAATLGSTFVGHYPWFATFNLLQASVPEVGDGLAGKLVRNAFIGLCASGVSDCCSNSFRVVKTMKQTATEQVSYTDAIQGILKTDGVQGLLGRGLQTRLVTNGLQGMLFSVVWKLFDEYWK